VKLTKSESEIAAAPAVGVKNEVESSMDAKTKVAETPQNGVQDDEAAAKSGAPKVKKLATPAAFLNEVPPSKPLPGKLKPK
jgi:hypothetical protein